MNWINFFWYPNLFSLTLYRKNDTLSIYWFEKQQKREKSATVPTEWMMHCLSSKHNWNLYFLKIKETPIYFSTLLAKTLNKISTISILQKLITKSWIKSSNEKWRNIIEGCKKCEMLKLFSCSKSPTNANTTAATYATTITSTTTATTKWWLHKFKIWIPGHSRTFMVIFLIFSRQMNGKFKNTSRT